MPLQLDHAVIAVSDLDTATHDYQSLGFTVLRGGVHANRATHNALITFPNGTYLELLAATADSPRPGVIDFSMMLRQGEGLAGFALRSDDLAADTVRLRAQEFAVNDIIPGERRREDDTLVQWKLALIDNEFIPFLIEDVTPRAHRIPTDPAITTHANGVSGLCAVEIAVGDMAAAQALYGKLFGLSLPASAASRRSIGDVILWQSTTVEGLYALHLEASEPQIFPPDRTHGVRFEVTPHTA